MWQGAPHRVYHNLRQPASAPRGSYGVSFRRRLAASQTVKPGMIRSKQRILHLTLHRQFFVEIAAGTKPIEYRDQTPYWKRRLEGREYDAILFRNGYSSNAPEMLVELSAYVATERVARPIMQFGSGAFLKSNGGQWLQSLREGEAQVPLSCRSSVILSFTVR
jgi:hypothetical protein